MQVLKRVQSQESGVQLLTELSKAWQNHEIMVRWLTRFFNYLDRHALCLSIDCSSVTPSSVLKLRRALCRYYVVRHNLPQLNQVGLICFRGA